MRVAVFRPDDGRLDAAAETLRSLGADPVADSMLGVEATGATAREDADWTVFTSSTGVAVAADAGWAPGRARVCAIGPTTAEALEAAGHAVELVPERHSSAGLVAALDGQVDGARVEVARSAHGSDALLDGLGDAGAYVHETRLYRLVRPPESGESTAVAAEGALDGAVFTSSRTVEHFLDAAEERGVREAAVAGLGDAVVGAIGEPTAETARAHGVEVDVVPADADFEALAERVVELAAEPH